MTSVLDVTADATDALHVAPIDPLRGKSVPIISDDAPSLYIVGGKVDVQYIGNNEEKIDKSWHVASIVEISADDRRVLIRYDSEIDSDEDEWIHSDSSRITSLHKHTTVASTQLSSIRRIIRLEMSIADWKPIKKPPAIQSTCAHTKHSYYYSIRTSTEYLLIITPHLVRYKEATSVYRYDIKSNETAFLFTIPFPFEMGSLFALDPSSGNLFAFSSVRSDAQCFLYHLEEANYPQIKIHWIGDDDDDDDDDDATVPSLVPMICNNDSAIYLRHEEGVLSYDWREEELQEKCEESLSFSKHPNAFPIFYNLHLNSCVEYRGGGSYYTYCFVNDEMTVNQHTNSKLNSIYTLKHIVSFGAIITFHYVDEEGDHQLLFLDADDHKVYECKHSLGWRTKTFKQHMFVTMNGILHAVNFDACNESEFQLNVPPFHMHIKLKDIVPKILFRKYNGVYFNVDVLLDGFIRSIDHERISIFSFDMMRLIHCHFVTGA